MEIGEATEKEKDTNMKEITVDDYTVYRPLTAFAQFARYVSTIPITCRQISPVAD